MSGMSRCGRLQDELKAYVDGELPPVNRLAVRLHVARCAACREEVEAMEQASSELRASEPANVLDAALRARILESVPPVEHGIPDTADTSGARQATWLRRHAMEAWAAAAVVTLLWFVLTPYFAQSREKARIAYKSAGRLALAGRPSRDIQNYDASVPASAAPGPGQPTTMIAGSGMGSGAVYSSGSDLRNYAMQQAKPVAAGKPSSLPSIERKVTRTADITVEVEGLEAKSDSVEQMVKASGGFVANNQLSTGDDNLKTASLTVNVPVEKFDTILRDVAKLGEVKAKNVAGEDITEKLSDEQQAVNVLTGELSSARAKLAKRDVPEYAVQNLKIRAAQAQGRLDLLRKLAAFSTIGITLREKSHTPVRTGGFLEEMGDTGNAAVNSFLAAARLPVLLLIWVLAYSPVWIPLVIAYRFAARANRRRVAAGEVRRWQESRSAGEAAKA